MLRIIGIARSRAFRCLWAAEEAGIAYEHIPTPFADIRSAPFIALNPNGKLPAMQDGDLTLFESLAINLHIASKVGAPFNPGGDDHSRALQWTLWAATEAEPAMFQWGINAYMRPPEQRDAARAAEGKAGTDARLEVLEGHLAQRPYLLGEHFTIADCNLAGIYYGSWMNGYEFHRFPKVLAWLERCLTRPAALRARRLREDWVGDVVAFRESLAAEGYAEVVERKVAADMALPTHTHAWDARGFVLAGEFRVISEAEGSQGGGPGASFTLAANTPHHETTGPAGARVLIGRRHP
jgi:glutathione S-transferase